MTHCNTKSQRRAVLSAYKCVFSAYSSWTVQQNVSISKALRYGPCVTTGSHSFTCHPHTNHTCLYSPAARRHHPLASIHCAYPRKDGQAELTWWLVTYRDKCPAPGIEPGHGQPSQYQVWCGLFNAPNEAVVTENGNGCRSEEWSLFGNRGPAAKLLSPSHDWILGTSTRHVQMVDDLSWRRPEVAVCLQLTVFGQVP